MNPKFLLAILFMVGFTMACDSDATSNQVATEPMEEFDPNAYILSEVPGTDYQKAVRKAADGSTLEEGFIRNGEKTGTWVTYHPNSIVPKTVVSYLNGKYNGIYMEFNDRGYLELQAAYHNNLLDGPWAKYRFGRPTNEAEYKDGKLNGVYREYVMNTGKLQKEITYKDGVMNGPYRFYNEKGEVTLEYDYENGERIAGGITHPGRDNAPR